MTKIVLVMMAVMLGWCGAWAGAQPGTEALSDVVLESVDGRTMKVEVLDIAERVVKVRTAQGKVLTIKYDLLSHTSQAVLEQLTRSSQWMARGFPEEWKVRWDQGLREERVATLGGDVKSEDAVLKALRWLKNVQNKDGSWGAKKVAYTGLALQCFTGRGYSPLSEEFGECYTAGLVYLTDVSMRNKGRMADNLMDKHWAYEHAIATEAVIEGYMICKLLGIKLPHVEQAAQSGAQMIIDNQHRSGGWEYAYGETTARGGDLSITSWQVSALHAARVAKLDLRNLDECLGKARKYVLKRQADHGGFGYTGTTPVGLADGHHTLTGAGVRCLQICGMAARGSWASKQRGSSQEERGIEYIGRESKFDWENGPANLYSLYHENRALARQGGAVWLAYQKQWRPDLLKHQSASGSWPKPEDPGVGNPGDPIYNTCLVTLILESYYR